MGDGFAATMPLGLRSEPQDASRPFGECQAQKVQIGDATLYLADCRDVLPLLSGIDAVVTDVPYGVAGGWGSGLRKGSSRPAKSAYSSTLFIDNREHVETVVVPAIQTFIDRFGRVALTPGIRHQRLYPEPAHVGSFQYPGTTVMSCWGPVLWQPILYYGRDPHQGKLRPDSRPNCNDVDRTTPHPCPKPLKQWTWLVERASLAGETVLDPFMGSGTTGVACAMLGRSFVGIEIDPAYFETACRRIEDAQRQHSLFEEARPAKVDERLCLRPEGAQPEGRQRGAAAERHSPPVHHHKLHDSEITDEGQRDHVR